MLEETTTIVVAVALKSAVAGEQPVVLRG